MDYFLPPAVIQPGSGSENEAVPLCWTVGGEKSPGVLCKGMDSASVQLSFCPALLEAVERRTSAGFGRLRPA